MAIFIYKAVDKRGQIVQNRVEEINKFALLSKLKKNQLLPISVSQINVRNKSQSSKKQKRNIEANDSVLKSVRKQEELKRRETKTQKFLRKSKDLLISGSKITNRDIVIFTQNFFLLKKANFNNIHALSTIIETTENASLKAIIEDILVRC